MSIFGTTMTSFALVGSTGEAFKKLRVMVLCHEDLVPPDSIDDLTPKEVGPFKTEWDVISTLKKVGHEVLPVGVYNNLGVIGNALLEFKPQIAFNLLEEFHGYPLYDQHVVSYLELMKQPYTGCNPRGLTICRDKALSKMVLAYHRIQVPAFAVFHMNRVVKRSKRLKFPLLVKSISEEGSVGIARASIVNDDAKLAERVDSGVVVEPAPVVLDDGSLQLEPLVAGRAAALEEVEVQDIVAVGERQVEPEVADRDPVIVADRGQEVEVVHVVPVEAEGREGVAAFLEKRRAAWILPEPEPTIPPEAPPGI